MLAVVRQAASLARGRTADSPFDLWWDLRGEQDVWASREGLPPLLSHFGVTLVERAVIDAWCRDRQTPFHRALRENSLGLELGRIHQSLTRYSPADLLPARPAESVTVRHTVGLADPLRDKDIPEGERLADGLPHSLEACIDHYGLTQFKIKVQGAPETDLPRLRTIASVIRTAGLSEYEASLDGNESFRSGDAFGAFWQSLLAEPELKPLLSRLLFIEQPLHREIALEEPVPLLARPDGTPCPVIIDESDAELDSLPRALALGYSGTSHKNCKGVFKGIANRCLIDSLNRSGDGRALIMSGEDLANIGPVALLQDLAVQAVLGITSVERNGHHYFAGLAAFPESLQNEMTRVHPDLYLKEPGRPARLRIDSGKLSTRSLLEAPFGYAARVKPETFARPV